MDTARSEDRSEFIRAALERYEAPLMRYALGFTGEIESARDVVQDTFLRLCDQPIGKVDDHLAQWLFTVCRNRALDVQRKESRMIPMPEADQDSSESSEPSPALQVERREAARNILDLMGDLPRNQREVLRLKFHGQLSYEEIAAITQLSVGNVGFLLHTALKTLRLRMARLETLPGAGAFAARPTR